MRASKHKTCTGIPLPILRRRTALPPLEYPVEIRQVIKTALITNLRDAIAGIGQARGGLGHPYLIQVIDEGLSRPPLQETHQGSLAHAYQSSDFRQAYPSRVILAQIQQYRIQAIRVAIIPRASRRVRGI